MAFHFPLQPVLRLRASFERVELLRLLALNAVIVRVREEIAALDHQSLLARQRVQRMLAVGSSGMEVQVELACERARGGQRRALEARLADFSRRQDKQRRAYLGARQKRAILENLRTRKWTEYQKQQSRVEEQRLNDLFLVHRFGKTLD